MAGGRGAPRPGRSRRHGPPPRGKGDAEEASRAAEAFGLKRKQVEPFSEVDPFNPENRLDGFFCRKQGVGGGCLFISAVNGTRLAAPVAVHGEPRSREALRQLADASPPELDVPEPLAAATSYCLVENWHGRRCVAFTYPGSEGTTCVSFTVDQGPLCSTEVKRLIMKALGLRLGQRAFLVEAGLPRQLQELHSAAIGSLVFRLCGRGSPRQIVLYESTISLKLIVLRGTDGRLRPPSSCQLAPCHSPTLYQQLTATLVQDVEKNQQFRQEKGLSLVFEAEHFATAGRVVYIVDADGTLLGDTLYLLTPLDYQDARDAPFDARVQDGVRAAMTASPRRPKEPMEDYLRRVCAIGPNSWFRFRKRLVEFASLVGRPVPQPPPRGLGDAPSPVLLVLVGTPGCGKSTLSETLERDRQWVRVCQDDLKTAKRCQEVAEESLKSGKSVVIDRTNIDVDQRRKWLQMGAALGVAEIHAVFFKVPLRLCISRVMQRRGHKTLPPGDASVDVINKFAHLLTAPTTEEGFSEVRAISTREEALALVLEYRQLAGQHNEREKAGAEESASLTITPPAHTELVPRDSELPFRPAWGPADPTIVTGGLPRFSSRLLAGLVAQTAASKEGPETPGKEPCRLFCNARYIGVSGRALEEDISMLGAPVPQDYVDSRKSRNDPLHITIISPLELYGTLERVHAEHGVAPGAESLNWLLDWLAVNLSVPWTVNGLCSQTESVAGVLSNEVLYLAVEWERAQAIRGLLGLPRHQMHITVGFHFRDIHDPPKTGVPLASASQHLCALQERDQRCRELLRSGVHEVNVASRAVAACADAAAALRRCGVAEQPSGLEAGLVQQVTVALAAEPPEADVEALWRVIEVLAAPFEVLSGAGLSVPKQRRQQLGQSLGLRKQATQSPYKWIAVGRGMISVGPVPGSGKKVPLKVPHLFYLGCTHIVCVRTDNAEGGALDMLAEALPAWGMEMVILQVTAEDAAGHVVADIAANHAAMLAARDHVRLAERQVRIHVCAIGGARALAMAAVAALACRPLLSVTEALDVARAASPEKLDAADLAALIACAPVLARVAALAHPAVPLPPSRRPWRAEGLSRVPSVVEALEQHEGKFILIV